MAFDLDDEELEATRRLNGVDEIELERRDSQSEAKYWNKKYIETYIELIKEKEKNKKLEEVINNLAKAVKFMGTNEELTTEDIIKMFSPEEIKMDFDDFMKRWENEQLKKGEIKDKVIDMMAEDISNSDIDEDICRQSKMKEDCYADTVEDNSACKECIKEYYFKKARGE